MTGTVASTQAHETASDRWQRVWHVPCTLTIEIAIPGFRVSDLVHLAPGRVLGTRIAAGQDVPLRINGEIIAWTEFEAVRDRLAVRITELA